MWSPWPCVSSTRRTPSVRQSSSSRSCSLAASMSTASPVLRQRTTNTLLSYGPTTTLCTSTSASDQWRVDGDGDGAGSALIASPYRPVRCSFDEGAADLRAPGAGGGPRRSVRAGLGGELVRRHRRPAPGRLGALRRVD